MAAPVRKTREQDTREMTARPTAYHYTPPSLIGMPPARPGYHLRLIREYTTDGNIDRDNLDRRYREGYRPIRAADYPDWCLGEKGDDPIRRGSGIIMEIPVERAEARRDYYRRRSHAQSAAVDREQGMLPRGGIIPTKNNEVGETVIGGRRIVGAPE
jgi:hypothetical protein